MTPPSITFDIVVCSMWCGSSRAAPGPAELILSGLGLVLRRRWSGVAVRVHLAGRLCRDLDVRFSVLKSGLNLLIK